MFKNKHQNKKLEIKSEHQCLSKTVYKLLCLFSIQLIIITLSADQVSFFHAFSS